MAEPVAVAAAFLAALFLGVEGILGKRGMEAGGNPILVSLLVAVVSMLIFGGIAVADSTVAAVAARHPLGIAAFLLAGAVASGLGVLAIWQGVHRVGASVNTAVVNSRPLFATALGYLFLAESLPPAAVLGVVVLVAGLALIGLSRGGDVRGWAAPSLLFPLAAALLFASGNVLRRYALSRTAIPLFEGIAINAVGGLVVLGAYVLVSGRLSVLRAPRRAYAWFTLTSLSTAGALLALFFALERARVAIVDSIAGTAPLFTLALAAVFLGDVERVTRRLVAGAVLVVVGVVLIVGG